MLLAWGEPVWHGSQRADQPGFELFMPKSPLVSVIIPAYNAAAFIRHTLVSVLSQTYRNIEVIVVDDGSQDQTSRIVNSIAARDDRVTLLRQPNKGVAAARNLGIEKSKGEYISPIDADDIWYPQKIEKQVQYMQNAGPSTGLVYCWWVFIDERGLILRYSYRWKVEGLVYKALLSFNFVGNSSTNLIRRSCIEHVGYYDEEFKQENSQGCEDWDLSLRLAEHYKFCVVPIYLVGYRGVTNSMSRNLASMERSYELVIKRVKRSFPGIDDEIYCWSRSQFYYYLAKLSYRNGNYWAAFSWLYRALFSDNVAILTPWRIKVIADRLPKIGADWMTSLIWNGRSFRAFFENMHI
jgi:glycosyltransferase involved in cell wall biosynthesis